MKAIVYERCGSPDVLRCEEIEKPAVGDSQVLIKVRAASVNPLELGKVKGIPYLARVIFGLRKPDKGHPAQLGVEVPDALRYLEQKHARGKVVIRVVEGFSSHIGESAAYSVLSS